jgi:hypothetical protein
MSVFAKANSMRSSRRQISIKGVRDGVLMLPDNQYRVILEASSINFELKSSDEQDVIIDTYRGFLNSLPCDVQIVTRIREMDMAKYLDEFREASSREEDPVYREQIASYAEFVQQLVTTNKILSRRFYIVIPHLDTDKGGFEGAQEQLTFHVDIVSKGLSRLGIQTRRLKSIEVLDLFYSFYNPELAKRQPLRAQTLQLLKDSFI